MKHTTTVSGITLIVLLLVHTASAQTLQSNAQQNKDVTAVDGAWDRFYYHNGTKVTTGEPKEFVLLHDGFFSSIGQDSTGSWSNTYAGTYELSGNTLKNTLRYSSHPERVGSIHWADYELKGDTLAIKWFQKLVTAQGQDLTAQMPKSESRYVRAKK